MKKSISLDTPKQQPTPKKDGDPYLNLALNAGKKKASAKVHKLKRKK